MPFSSSFIITIRIHTESTSDHQIISGLGDMKPSPIAEVLEEIAASRRQKGKPLRKHKTQGPTVGGAHLSRRAIA
jgi:hypothetical protein